MKRILIPCDFSITTENAIKFAIDLAEETDELFLVNIMNDNGSFKILTAHDPKLREIELKFGVLFKKHPTIRNYVHQKILSGKFLPTILKFVESENIDIIVMGTHGSRGWGEFFMGSNIEKIVRTSPVPVFAVKGTHNIKSIRNIVFPCNLKLDQPEVLLKVKDLQKLFHARLHILHINTGKSLNDLIIIRKLEEYCKHYQLSNFTVNVSNEADERRGILHFAKEINADMIAMVTKGKRDLRHLFTESITADIVNHANILVWTCTS